MCAEAAGKVAVSSGESRKKMEGGLKTYTLV
jgi:hypothetical protein